MSSWLCRLVWWMIPKTPGSRSICWHWQLCYCFRTRRTKNKVRTLQRFDCVPECRPKLWPKHQPQGYLCESWQSGNRRWRWAALVLPIAAAAASSTTTTLKIELLTTSKKSISIRYAILVYQDQWKHNLITKTYKKQKLKLKLTRCNNPHSTPNKRFFLNEQ